MVFAFIFVNNHKLNLPLVCATRDPTRRREQSPPRGHPGYLGGYFGISSEQSKRPQFARPRTVPSLNPFATELQNIPSTSYSRLRACFPFFPRITSLASIHTRPSDHSWMPRLQPYETRFYPSLRHYYYSLLLFLP